MKDFAIVYIHNNRLTEEDPADFKGWRVIQAEDKQSAIAQVEEYGLVIECREVPE